MYNLTDENELIEFLKDEGSADYNNEKWLIPEGKLDDEQYRVLNRNDKDFIVSGCAGSGKTILAIYRAKKIVQEKKGSCLFIVFTKVLKRFIENAMEDVENNLNNINIFYKDEFLGIIKEEEEIIKYDYIILDEVQDLDESFIKKLKERCNKQIICLGDNDQQIFEDFNNGTTLESIAKTIDIEEFEKLNRNYRVSKSIAEFAGRIIDDGGKLIKSCKNDYGMKPKILKFTSIDAELDNIIDIVEKEALTDVAILAHTNSIAEQIVKYLKSKNKEVEYKYNDLEDIDFKRRCIKVLTYHSSKGLEFDTVFLPNCEISIREYNYREALYVACTRAKKRLYISYNDKLSEFITLD